MVRRVLAAALLVGIAVGLVIAGWPQLLGLQRAPVVAQVVSLRAASAVIAAVLAVLLLILAAASRAARRLAAGLAALLLAFTAASAAVLSVRGLGGTDPADDADSITVLSWNTLGDLPGATRITELALEAGADIVTLPETSNTLGIEIAQRMTDAGRPMSPHNFRYDTYAKAQTTVALISRDLGTYVLDQSIESTPVLPSGIWRPADGDGPTIIAAHPVAPVPGRMRQWREGLEWLADRCREGEVIIGGDLNSTLDHWAGLGDGEGVLGGCRDAARDAGAAGVGTWPTQVPPLLGVPIDHVMSTPEWRASSFRVLTDDDASGSDHRPIVATLERVG